MKYGYKIIWLWLALAAGLFGGVLHGHELIVCFDEASGLYTPDYASYLLPSLCACAFVLFLICALSLEKKEQIPYFTRFSMSRSAMGVQVLAGFLVLAGGAVLLRSFLLDHSIYNMLLGIYTLLAGVCVIRLASLRAKESALSAAKSPGIVILFWICFVLLYTFMEHPVEPILQVFAYDLLAICAAALSLYCHTGRIFEKYRGRLGALASLLAVMLLTVAAFGRLSAFVLSGSISYVTNIAFRFPVMLALILMCGQDAASYLRLPVQQTEASEEEHAGL